MQSPHGHAAFTGLIDLVSSALGGQALLCSDDFFASMHNLIKVPPAIFDADRYTERGKWMDGWESRRERIPGHDWCILKLGVPGRIHGVDIDTSHFLGNHPPFASLDGTHAPENSTPETLRDHATWEPLLPPTALQRGSSNLAAIQDTRTWTHVRLNIHPDGGVARLRVFGESQPEPSPECTDLACVTTGARAIACSDMFFSPMINLLLPLRAEHMGQGWETRRSRPPGQDWLILALGQPGRLDHLIIDTNHFKGNFPDRAVVEGLYWPDAPAPDLIDHADWRPITDTVKLSAHEQRRVDVTRTSPLTHLRLRIFPDGGVSRLRAMGVPTTDTPAHDDPMLSWLNELSSEAARAVLSRCCGATLWADAMVAARPFQSRTQLHGHARFVWWRLAPADWREAFTHHPQIGASRESLRARFGQTAEWSADEQHGVTVATEETIDALASGNVSYEERHGFIFIVCASGLTAQEMLKRLRERLDNPRDAELRIAAGEQVKITALRLDKLETPS
jgi:allantoicase